MSNQNDHRMSILQSECFKSTCTAGGGNIEYTQDCPRTFIKHLLNLHSSSARNNREHKEI